MTLSIRETFRATGVTLGDLATVVSPRTGLACHAIVGDRPAYRGGGASVLLAEALGLALGDPAVYLVHPGSGRGQGTIPTNAQIHRRGDRLFRRPRRVAETWEEILADCFGDLFRAEATRDRASLKPVAGHSSARRLASINPADQPDVAVLDRVAVVLEMDRPGRARVAAEAGDGVVDGDLDVLVDRDAVLEDGDPRRLDLLAVLEDRGRGSRCRSSARRSGPCRR